MGLRDALALRFYIASAFKLTSTFTTKIVGYLKILFKTNRCMCK